MREKVINRQEGTAQCMLETEHDAHRWAYTSWGGGHMIELGLTEEKGYKEWDCPGYTPEPRKERVAERAESVVHPWDSYDNDMGTYAKADIEQTMRIFEELKKAPKITDDEVRDTFSRHPHDGQVCPWSADIFDKWLEDRDERIRKQAREDAFEEAARMLLLEGIGVMTP